MHVFHQNYAARTYCYLLHMNRYTYVTSSTCKGTFSAPSGGSLAKRYELFGLGDDAYLKPVGTSGELLSLPLVVCGALDSPDGVLSDRV